jgi:rare lipoprotein A
MRLCQAKRFNPKTKLVRKALLNCYPMKLLLLTFCMSFGFLAGAQSFQWDNQQAAQETTVTPSAVQGEYTGLALVYPDYYEGNPTALGENYYHNLLTGAHPKLPLGTMVKVTRLDNGLATTVRINDRGAYCDGCVIDLSKAAAQQIKLNADSRCKVTLSIIDPKEPAPLASAPAPSRPKTQLPADTRPQLTAKGGSPIVPNEYQDLNPSTVTSDHTAEPQFTYRGEGVQQYETSAIQQTAETESEADIVSRLTIAPLDYLPEAGQVNVIAQPISIFSVQLGSYSKLSNAERHILKLAEAGFNNVFLLKEKKADGQMLNRVIIAPFDTLEDAQDYQDDLQEYHQMKSLILQAGL